MGLFYLIDVALGPSIFVYGFMILLLITFVAAITFFSIKAIIKIKRNRDNNASD